MIVKLISIRPHVNRGLTFVRHGDEAFHAECYDTPQESDLWQPGPDGSKIAFIKAVRAVTGYGLKEAKDVADALEAGETTITLPEAGATYRKWLTGYDGYMCQGDPEPRPDVSTLARWATTSRVFLARWPLLSKLLDEFEAVGPRNLASENGVLKKWELSVDGYSSQPVAWKRGRADKNALGPRTYAMRYDLRYIHDNVSVFIGADDLMLGAANLLVANGSSRSRAQSMVGVLLLTFLLERKNHATPRDLGKLSPPELLAHEAARRLST